MYILSTFTSQVNQSNNKQVTMYIPTTVQGNNAVVFRLAPFILPYSSLNCLLIKNNNTG